MALYYVYEDKKMRLRWQKNAYTIGIAMHLQEKVYEDPRL